MLTLVCPKQVWLGARKKLPGSTKPIYRAKFHSIKHTEFVRYAMGHLQCMYAVPGFSEPLSLYVTKREYPYGGEYSNVKCTIDGRRMTCAEKSFDIPDQPMETPKLPKN